MANQVNAHLYSLQTSAYPPIWDEAKNNVSGDAYEMKKMCVEFEAELLRHLFTAMDLFSEKNDSTSALPADLEMEMARALAEKGCTGIAQQLYSYLCNEERGA